MLIQNAIEDDIMKDAEAQKEKVMFMIKTQQLKQNLKPVSTKCILFKIYKHKAPQSRVSTQVKCVLRCEDLF